LVDKRNEGSKVVLLRNNFQFEGVLREYEFEHGKYIDLEMYSILGKDFINKRQTS
jgi:ribosomal-protein-alanine N-acetyltransferase